MVAATFTQSITSGDFTPTSANPTPEWQTATRFVLTGTPGTPRLMIVPDTATFSKLFIVQNDSDDQVTVQVGVGPSGTTVVIPTDDGRILYSDGTDIVELTSADFIGFDIGGFFGGKPVVGALLLKFVVVRAFTLPINLTGSQGHAETAANAESDFDIQKNSVSIGTMRFAASGTVATFIHASATSFVAGDQLSIVAPNPQDANLADVAMTLLGIRD